MERNEITLDARLLQSEALRYTPAGIPVLNFRIEHDSRQMEAGTARQVSLEMQAIALGPVAMRLAALSQGQALRLCGFIAARSRLSSQIVLHVNEFDNQ